MTGRGRRTSTEGGFSLVEVLIAAAVLLVVTIGVLPMFTRAIANNQQGRQLTELVYEANSEIEDLVQRTLDDAALAVDPGDQFGTPAQPGRETIELYSREDEQWYLEANFPNGQDPVLRRAIRVRQYQLPKPDQDLGNWRDADGNWEEIAVVGTLVDAPQSHLKEIEVLVTVLDPSIFGPRRQLTLRYYKAF